MRTASLFPLAFCLCLLPAPAIAQNVLYENGPINGQTEGWNINFGFVTSNSFTLVNPSQVGGISFGAWLSPGDSLASVEVSITDQPGIGAPYFEGVVDFTASGCFLNSLNYDVCTETGHFSPVQLDAGTYYLNLFNAVSGDPIYWDENDGIGCHSQGCPSMAFIDTTGTIPSESFTILGSSGTTGTTPEPGSILLFASGALGSGSILRQKLRKSR